jgi:hypothetical protein
MHAKKTYYIISSIGLFLSTAIVVFAQEGYRLLAEIPTVTSKTPSFVEYLKGIFVAGVGLAIIFAVIMIIIGALGYVMAAVPSAKSEGKKKMTDALFGLLILLVSTVILVTINPDLMRTGLNLTKLGPPQGLDFENKPVYCRTGFINNGCYPTKAQCEGPESSYTCTENAPASATVFCFVDRLTQTVSSCNYDSIVTCQAALVITGTATSDCKAVVI